MHSRHRKKKKIIIQTFISKTKNNHANIILIMLKLILKFWKDQTSKKYKHFPREQRMGLKVEVSNGMTNWNFLYIKLYNSYSKVSNKVDVGY